MLEPNSLQLASPLTTQAWDIATDNPFDLTNLQSNQTMMPALPEVINVDARSVNEVSILPGVEALDSLSLFLSSPSPTFDLQQTLEAYFSQPNWQTLQAPELPFIQVVSEQSLGSQPATVDPLTGFITLSDTFVAQHASQPATLANLVLNTLLQKDLFGASAEFSQPTEASTLSEAFDQAQIYLKYLFSQSDWTERTQLAFGNSIDNGSANDIAQRFLNDELTLQSLVEVLPAETLKGTNGVFDAIANRIYISDVFIHANINNSNAVMTVLLAEFGHYLDAQLNLSDAQGDEGEIFAALVRGYTLTETNLAALKAEDDHIILMLDGQEHLVEHSVQSPVSGVAPDLVPITATTFNSDHLYGKGYFPVSWSVGNFGNQTAVGWTDEVYISNDPFFDSSDYWLWTDNYERYGGTSHFSLKPGYFDSRYEYAYTGYSWIPRIRYLLLVVDPGNRVAESNENNNVRVFEVGPMLGNFDGIPLPSELRGYLETLLEH
jgi:CARDB